MHQQDEEPSADRRHRVLTHRLTCGQETWALPIDIRTLRRMMGPPQTR
jgi:hypothetical protein